MITIMNINSPTSLFSSSLSGMNAAQSRLQVSAHNIANLSTNGFTRQDIVQSDANGAGTLATIVNVQASGNNLEMDMVQQLQAKNAFLSNLSVFRTSEAMLGNLLDVLAM
jgi:flagellar hook-associated protein FlgK